MIPQRPQDSAVIWIIGPENYLLNERRREWTDGQTDRWRRQRGSENSACRSKSMRWRELCAYPGTGSDIPRGVDKRAVSAAVRAWSAQRMGSGQRQLFCRHPNLIILQTQLGREETYFIILKRDMKGDPLTRTFIS